MARTAELLGVLCLAALCLDAAAGLATSPSDPCTEPFAGIRPANLTYMLAIPREDTVEDRGGDASGFGQLVDVSRIDGAGADRVGSATERDGSVVLVPWGFDADCRPIRWTGSWRWADTGVEGFYRARLRPESRWIDERPTFDVQAAVWEGFPQSPWKHPMSVGRPHLSATELFELFDRLPTTGAISARPYGAVSDLVDWRRAAGDRAQRYPAGVLLNAAFAAAERARVRSARVPFGGTYSFRVEREEETIATFYLRTGSVGTDPIATRGADGGSPPLAPRPASAYTASAAVAPTLEGLGEAAGETPASACLRRRGLKVTADEAPREDAAHAWSAELSVGLVASCFSEHPALAGLRAPDPDLVEVEREGSPASRPFAGAFRQEVDGRFTFRQPARLDDGAPVRISGTRIDLAALPAPSPVAETASR